jgi:hypothetical protein
VPLDVDAAGLGERGDDGFVGSRIKNRLGLPFAVRSRTNGDAGNGNSVFKKLTDFLVDKLEIPVVNAVTETPEQLPEVG